MMEAATVFWTPEAAMMLVQPGTSIVHGGKDRSFGDLEAAVRFVMEDLPEGLRSTAMIQTDTASIQFVDIERLYKGCETGNGAQGQG
jgi:hypothetical protein